MKIEFLGTAASEGWPSLFCQCEACRRARAAGGRNIRTRQQVLLNDDLLLDFGPDTLMHVNQHGIDLSRIHDVLVTHAHSDHFYPEDMMKITCNYTPIIDNRLLNIYGNEDVVRAGNYAHEMKNRWKGYDSIHFELLKAFGWYEIAERYKVLVLPAVHDRSQNCFIYYISSEDCSVLYACDSGYFSDETFEALCGLEIDALILECTGIFKDLGHGHSNIEWLLKIRERLSSQGSLKEQTRTFATHVCHSGAFKDGRSYIHEELSDELMKHGVELCYDGMTVII